MLQEKVSRQLRSISPSVLALHLGWKPPRVAICDCPSSGTLLWSCLSLHKMILSLVRPFSPGPMDKIRLFSSSNQTGTRLLTCLDLLSFSLVFLEGKTPHLPLRSNSLNFCLKIPYIRVSSQNTITCIWAVSFVGSLVFTYQKNIFCILFINGSHPSKLNTRKVLCSYINPIAVTSYHFLYVNSP